MALACSRADRAVNGAPSKDELQHDIEDKIKPGATLQEIQHWLDTDGKDEGIEYPGLGHASEYSQLTDMGLDPNTPIYSGIIHGRFVSLSPVFVLDKDMRFHRLIILQHGEGP